MSKCDIRQHVRLLIAPMFRRPTLIETLRRTVEQIEEREKIHSDDPSLIELKRSVIRRIAELETEDQGLPDDADEGPAQRQT